MAAGNGGWGPINPGIEELAKQAHEMRRHRLRHDGHRPPKRPRGPRFGLLRRLVRVIRSGGP